MTTSKLGGAKHDDGFFLNCKTTTVWMLHRSTCPHPGGTDVKAHVWGSLTKKRKICSTNRTELEQRAREKGVHEFQVCSDCHPQDA
jgi:hypothetical protein